MQSNSETPLSEPSSEQRVNLTPSSAKIDHRIILPDANYIRTELPITAVAAALQMEVQGKKKVRCPNSTEHWADFWVCKNKVHCYKCTGGKSLWATIDLVMDVEDLDKGEAIKWVAQRFPIPTRTGRITSSRWGTTPETFLGYSARSRKKRLIPDIKTMRKAKGWASLSYRTRELATVLLEIIPRDILTVTTTQEKLRELAVIGNRGTMKKAMERLVSIGMIETQRTISLREPRTGQFTTDLVIRLTWGAPQFQAWLVAPSHSASSAVTATKYKCTHPVHGESQEVNTVNPEFGSESEHGDRALNAQDRCESEHGTESGSANLGDEAGVTVLRPEVIHVNPICIGSESEHGDTPLAIV